MRAVVLTDMHGHIQGNNARDIMRNRTCPTAHSPSHQQQLLRALPYKNFGNSRDLRSRSVGLAANIERIRYVVNACKLSV